jgi:hypothetical protein
VRRWIEQMQIQLISCKILQLYRWLVPNLPPHATIKYLDIDQETFYLTTMSKKPSLTTSKIMTLTMLILDLLVWCCYVPSILLCRSPNKEKISIVDFSVSKRRSRIASPDGDTCRSNKIHLPTLDDTTNNLAPPSPLLRIHITRPLEKYGIVQICVLSMEFGWSMLIFIVRNNFGMP